MPAAFTAARYLYVVFAPRIGKFAGWGREGRVDRYWVSQAASLSCAERKFDTLPAALVAPRSHTQSSVPQGPDAPEVQTRRGRQRYALRMETVEPVFGQIKQGRGFRQFLLRGLEKVQGEWSLICTGHNLLKLFRCGRLAPG